MSVETLTLAAYCVAIIFASLLGGWLPSMVRMTHTRTQLIMSCVAGLMLGVGLLHLVPHALAGLQHSAGRSAVDVVVWWTLIGLVAMVLLLRLFRFQLHDFDEDEHAHHHAHAHGDHHHGHGAATAHPLSWVGVALGMGLHSLVDGVALGASVYGSHVHGAEQSFSWIGLGVFLAILLHKPLDALSVISTMQAGGWSARARGYANVAFSILCPLGALLFVWGVGLLDNQDYVIGCALAFSAGVFLCISLSDLLPEVHFHSHDRVKLTISFLLGIALAYALRFCGARRYSQYPDLAALMNTEPEQPETFSRPRRVIYPPVWLVIGLIIIFVLDQYLPLQRFTGELPQALGSIAIVVGLLLLVLAGGLFKKADTELIPFREVRALVTDGVYRFTRNPMYLGMALILLGTACTTGTLAGVLVVPVFMVIIEVRFIRPEESMLRSVFGEEFDAYCARVRRWL